MKKIMIFKLKLKTSIRKVKDAFNDPLHHRAEACILNAIQSSFTWLGSF